MGCGLCKGMPYIQNIRHNKTSTRKEEQDLVRVYDWQPLISSLETSCIPPIMLIIVDDYQLITPIGVYILECGVE